MFTNSSFLPHCSNGWNRQTTMGLRRLRHPAWTPSRTRFPFSVIFLSSQISGPRSRLPLPSTLLALLSCPMWTLPPLSTFTTVLIPSGLLALPCMPATSSFCHLHIVNLFQKESEWGGTVWWMNLRPVLPTSLLPAAALLLFHLWCDARTAAADQLRQAHRLFPRLGHLPPSRQSSL